MQHIEKQPKRETSINIRKADNGYVVSVYGEKQDKTYVYKTLGDAIKELESIFSVAGEKAANDSENDLAKTLILGSKWVSSD